MILTAEARRKLKDSDFAIPSERKYPIHNPDHARAALSRVSEFGTPAEKKTVTAAVHRKYPKMGKGDWTKTEDDDYDKSHGIKEGSKKDQKIDAKHGVKDSADDKLNSMMKGL